MAEYPLRIKATLDTSQVQQQLNNLKVPGSGGAGGGASAEIEKAAKTVNLRALASGFNLLSREMNKLSQTLGGDGLTKRIGDLAQSANGAITAFKAFGAPGAAIYVAMEAINAWADSVMKSVDTYNQAAAVIARIAGERRVEKAQERYAGMSDKELTEARDRAKAALEDAKNKEIEVANVAKRMGEIANGLALRGKLSRADELNAEARSSLSTAATKTADARSTLAVIDAELSKRKGDVIPEVDYTGQGMDALQKFFDSIRNWAEMSEDEYNEIAASAADAESKLRRFAEIIEGGFSITEAQQRQIEELTEVYKTAKDRMDQYERRRAQLEEERARREEMEQEQQKRSEALHDASMAGQRRFFDRIDFDNQLGVYAGQAGSLTDRQRESMERRRAQLEKENAELRQRSEAGEEIDLTKFQENMRRIDNIAGVLDQDAAMKSQGKGIPSWLDGVEERTNDWFHSIGGSVGGENSLQNDEYRVLQEIERLVRESTGYARQTAQSVA